MIAREKQTRQTILRLLNNLGEPKEIRQYLKRYSDLAADRFAVVKVGGATLQSQLQALGSSLAFLQEVGLTPIVIHGAGPQLNHALKAEGVGDEKKDGVRVTTPKVLKIARKVFAQENLKLTQVLKEYGTQATAFVGGVFDGELLDEKAFGLVGRVQSVNLEAIRAALKERSIPVIAPLAETDTGQILNINADFAANAIVQAVRPSKIIFLTDTGGILDASGSIISSINLRTDYAGLMQKDWLHSGMRLKLEQIHTLLSDLPSASSVSVTHPQKLAKELFTHRGSGTLVRMGEKIHTYSSWSDIDQDAFKTLLENSFSKSLAKDYFETTPIHQVFVADSYRAAAVIVQDENHHMRMDKFAVTAEAQGEGLGGAVWKAVRSNYPSLYWRARQDNPISQFYFQQADGAIKKGHWTVFWYGFDELDGLPHLVEDAVSLKETMI